MVMDDMDVRRIVVVVEDVEVARTALQWALHNLLRYGDLITLLHVFSAAPSSRSNKKKRLLRLKGFQLALSFKDICNNNFFNTNVEIIVTEGDQAGGRIAAMVREIGAFALVLGLHDQSFLYKTKTTLGKYKNWSTTWMREIRAKILKTNEYIKHTIARDMSKVVKRAKMFLGSTLEMADGSANVSRVGETWSVLCYLSIQERFAMADNNVASNFNCKILAIKQQTFPQTKGSSRASSAATTPDSASSINLELSQIQIGTLEVPYVHPPKIPYKICPDPTAIIWRSRKSRRREHS